MKIQTKIRGVRFEKRIEVKCEKSKTKSGGGGIGSGVRWEGGGSGVDVKEEVMLW